VRDLALAGLRVLVMEDEILIAMDVEQLCREQGAVEVVLVRAAEEAGAAMAGRFDAAILDVALGGDSTLGFAARLVEAGVPFVFATGHADAEGLFDAFPGVAVVGKPYAGGALIEALARAIAQGGGVTPHSSPPPGP
jgi:CheY-like chemotaxis protein